MFPDLVALDDDHAGAPAFAVNAVLCSTALATRISAMCPPPQIAQSFRNIHRLNVCAACGAMNREVVGSNRDLAE